LLGLIYLAPLIEERLGFVTTKWKIKEIVVATISTQLFVLPALLYMMGELSLVALPVNLLVLGIIPITMLFGFLTGFLGFLSTLLAIPFSWISFVLLDYQLKVVEIFSSIPFASLSGFYLPFSVVILIYIVYIFLIVKIKKREITEKKDDFPKASDFSIVGE